MATAWTFGAGYIHNSDCTGFFSMYMLHARYHGYMLEARCHGCIIKFINDLTSSWFFNQKHSLSLTSFLDCNTSRIVFLSSIADPRTISFIGIFFIFCSIGSSIYINSFFNLLLFEATLLVAKHQFVKKPNIAAIIFPSFLEM